MSLSLNSFKAFFFAGKRIFHVMNKEGEVVDFPEFGELDDYYLYLGAGIKLKASEISTRLYREQGLRWMAADDKVEFVSLDESPEKFYQACVYAKCNILGRAIHTEGQIPLCFFNDLEEYDLLTKVSSDDELSTLIENNKYVMTGDQPMFQEAGVPTNIYDVSVFMNVLDRIRGKVVTNKDGLLVLSA